MKKIFVLTTLFFTYVFVFAQVPDAIKYQTILRDNGGMVLQNKAVALKLSILSTSATGNVVYSERQQFTTNNYGLGSLNIGKGSVLSGNFTTIDWSTGDYFMKVEIDIAGGTNYILMGTSQLLSVPFAKYADISGKAINDLDISPTNELQTLALSHDTLSISNGNSILMPGFIPENTCLLGLNITPPFGYTYSGDNFNSQTSGWISKMNMPVQRYDCIGAVVNNKIYVIGGYNGSSNLNITQEYDPVTNSWSTKANMPTARAAIAGEAVNNKIYVFGGHSTGAIPIATVEAYDPLSNTWSTKTSMPTARDELSSAVLNNKIYVIGGWYSGGNSNKIEEYNPDLDTWATKTNMPTALRNQRSIGFNNKIYVMGGYSSNYTALNQEYDLATDTWSTKASMSYAIGDVHIAVLNNLIYIIGGGNGSGYYNYCSAYDPASNTWTSKPAMTTARSNGACVTWNNQIFVIGGCIAVTNTPTSANEAFSPIITYYIHCKF